MCSIAAAQIATTIFATAYTAQQQQEEGAFNRGVARYNARVAENKAEDVRRAGTEQELAQRQKSAELLSRQRAQAGASGVEIGSGSILQLQEDTQTLGEADALRIRSNTDQQFGALQTSADLTTAQGEFAASAGSKKAFGTVLGGASKTLNSGVADKWFKPNSSAFNIQSQTGFTGGSQGVLSGAEFAEF